MPNINLSDFSPWISGGLAGAFFTQIVNYTISRRSKTKATIEEKTIRFYDIATDLFDTNKDVNTTIQFKGHEYRHLSKYTTIIKNSGLKRVDNVQIIIPLAKNLNCLENNVKTFPIIIPHSETSNSDPDKNELVFSFDNFQKNDSIQISLFIDGELPDDMRSSVRNIDELKSSSKLSFDSTRDAIGLIILFFCLFTILGKVQIVGGALQLFLILTAVNPLSTCITKILRSIYKNGKNSTKLISIGEIRDNKSDVNIKIIHGESERNCQ
ncbi:hypothetical protein [Desulfovibrio sp. DV]|uniref:hypothetical protein n=1 Tax=Desulfovibrio sp. DV TaxID=1844708 RepID=UPI000A82F8E2|nr:hypothetical protein [Desulfovibrio sp. DV]